MEQQNTQLKQYIAALSKWWWLIATSVVVAAIVSYLATQAQPRQYWAGTTIMVGDPFRDRRANTGDIQISQVLAQSYADIATREPVLRSTLNALNLPWDTGTLRDKVTARVVAGTQLIQIAVIDADPNRAYFLAKTVAEQLILKSPTDSNMTDADRQLIHDQIENIKTNLHRADEGLKRQDGIISKAISGREMQAAESKITVLQQQIAAWQSTLANLLQQVQSSATNSLSVIEPPSVPVDSIGPDWRQNVALAIAIALALSIGAAMLLEYLDDTIKTPEDVRRTLNLTSIGAITQIDGGKDYSKKLAVSVSPLSRSAEAYRILRTNLQFKMIERSIRTLMVTSSMPMEGKSVTVSNLASVMAQSGKKVILVDADMRRPSIHKVFNINNTQGLTGALLHPEADIRDFITEDVLDNLSIMTSGDLPPDPAELLSSRRMKEVIDKLLERAEIVIFDTPPSLGVADTTALAGRVDGVLLVVDSRHTRRTTARAACEALNAVGAKMLGVVLNRVTVSGKDPLYMYYYPTRREVTDGPSHNGKTNGKVPGKPQGKAQKV